MVTGAAAHAVVIAKRLRENTSIHETGRMD
jgi:hypothetical protein